MYADPTPANAARAIASGPAPFARAPAPPWVVLDEFLAADERANLLRFANARALRFQPSEVLASDAASTVDPASRRSRVLFDLEDFESILRSRVLWSLPYAIARLGLRPFPISAVDVQLTVTHGGGFFRPHFDDDEHGALGRRLSFVYYFAREPRRFVGGELQLFASRAPDTRTTGVRSWRIQPGQNQCVLFESDRLHAVAPVICRSKDFGDGRFTVNGWILATRRAWP